MMTCIANMSKVIACICSIFGIIVCSVSTRADDAKIPSYDIEYDEDSTHYRQIYIDDGEFETYILIRNDTVILFDKVSKHTTYHRISDQ